MNARGRGGGGSGGSGGGVPGDGRADEIGPDPLEQIQLFARLDSTERAELLAAMRAEKVSTNQPVFWLGDRGDSFFVIRRGEVVVTVPNDKGEHVVLNTLGPGGFFGEISLLDGGPRTATIRAVTPCDLLVLSRDDFHAFLRKRPDVAIEILTVMGQRQRISTEALRNLKNPNEVFDRSQVSIWQRVSDVIATVAASQWFTAFHFAWFGLWIGMNIVGSLVYTGRIILSEQQAGTLPAWVFDPFPFGLLTMVVSLEAIFLSIFVMVSQNRQSEKDRLRTDLDYQVNVKAQTEIMGIARRLEALERVEERVEELLKQMAEAKPAKP
ncbi:MAG: cyclic nucleotide-binding domain-containing protein [Phycisphaerales bacterium]